MFHHRLLLLRCGDSEQRSELQNQGFDSQLFYVSDVFCRAIKSNMNFSHVDYFDENEIQRYKKHFYL